MPAARHFQQGSERVRLQGCVDGDSDTVGKAQKNAASWNRCTLGGAKICGRCRFRDENRNYVQQEDYYKLRVTCQR